MKRLPGFLFVAVTVLAVSEVHAQDAVPDTPTAKLNPEVERIISWLPVDTETLLVSQKPWIYQDIESYMSSLDSDAFTPEQTATLQSMVFRMMPAMFLLAAPTPGAGEKLVGQKITLAVNAGRNFAAPVVEGLGSFENCEFVVVDESAKPIFDAIIERCESEAAKTFEHAGVKVFVLDVKEAGSKPITLHFCSPEDRWIVCARTEEFLKQVLTRRSAEKHEDRALPASLPEWQRVNTRAEVWGIRHYNAERAEDDRSLPFSPVPAIPWRDRHAIGLTIAYQPSEKPGITLNHLTNSENAVEACREAWSFVNQDGGVEATRVAPNAVEVSVTPSDPFAVMNMYMLTFTYFGYMMMP